MNDLIAVSREALEEAYNARSTVNTRMKLEKILDSAQPVAGEPVGKVVDSGGDMFVQWFQDDGWNNWLRRAKPGTKIYSSPPVYQPVVPEGWADAKNLAMRTVDEDSPVLSEKGIRCLAQAIIDMDDVRLSATPQPASEAEQEDTRICKICDGGPGNYGACLCGAEAWDIPKQPITAQEAIGACWILWNFTTDEGGLDDYRDKLLRYIQQTSEGKGE